MVMGLIEAIAAERDDFEYKWQNASAAHDERLTDIENVLARETKVVAERDAAIAKESTTEGPK